MAAEHSLSGGPIPFGHFRSPSTDAKVVRRPADWYAPVGGSATAPATVTSRIDWYLVAGVVTVALALRYAEDHSPLDPVRGAPCGVVGGSAVILIVESLRPRHAEMEPGPDG